MNSINSLKAILAKSARTDKAREKEAAEKPKSTTRIELQYPKIMIPLLRVGTGHGATIKKSEDAVKTKGECEGNQDERTVKTSGDAELERNKSAETLSLKSMMSDGGSIISL